MSKPLAVAGGVVAVMVAAACATSARPAATGIGAPVVDARTLPREELERAEASRQAYTDADVHFMSGMIPHHAQAVVMAGWAPSHGAGRAVRAFCERVVVGQGDEIVLMQGWLRDRGQTVPPATATRLRMQMGGMEHDMLMPGMLTPEQMAELDRSRGQDFDRLFLRFMIQHHEGAILMVDELFGSPGAGHDDLVFKLASDIYADQTTEIAHMTKLLERIPSEGNNR